MKPSPEQLERLVLKLEQAVTNKQFSEIEKLNRLLKQVLLAIEQSHPSYLSLVVRLKIVHNQCRALVEHEQVILKQQLNANSSLRERDKAYTQTQVRAGE
ncbi:hypothetical protein VTH8203_01150 [Vibrio thalassae]|uniref:Uncharacterized protein n=1 Tax=Vibrio thalassae TaxID=1243014 RepID=A0A240EHW5_9VIBR|nr:hypothetical protein [Vibrio thalassae]SNX47540.1 hypothetical protein VTH8203_01150 [Vibrio thalassae]